MNIKTGQTTCPEACVSFHYQGRQNERNEHQKKLILVVLNLLFILIAIGIKYEPNCYYQLSGKLTVGSCEKRGEKGPLMELPGHKIGSGLPLLLGDGVAQGTSGDPALPSPPLRGDYPSDQTCFQTPEVGGGGSSRDAVGKIPRPLPGGGPDTHKYQDNRHRKGCG